MRKSVNNIKCNLRHLESSAQRVCVVGSLAMSLLRSLWLFSRRIISPPYPWCEGTLTIESGAYLERPWPQSEQSVNRVCNFNKKQWLDKNMRRCLLVTRLHMSNKKYSELTGCVNLLHVTIINKKPEMDTQPRRLDNSKQWTNLTLSQFIASVSAAHHH